MCDVSGLVMDVGVGLVDGVKVGPTTTSCDREVVSYSVGWLVRWSM